MVSWVQGNIEIADTPIFYNVTPNRIKKIMHFTLLALIDFCPVSSGALFTQTFDILLEIIIEYQI